MDGLFSFLTNGVVFFASAVFVLGLVVLIHELGHYQVGRWCGVGVERFSIGFGPEIYGVRDKAGTRWRIAAIPLGGYVKFVGDRDAASTGAVEVAPERAGEAYQNKSVWARMAIIAAGPAANFVLSFVILSAILLAVGENRYAPTIGQVLEDSAAQRAGLQEGDVILRLDGTSVDRAQDVQRRIVTSAETDVRLTVERNGREIELTARPERVSVEDDAGVQRRVGRLGVAFSTEGYERVRYGPFGAMARGAERTGEFTMLQLRFLSRLVTGRESVKELGGPLGIAQVSGELATRGYEGAAGPSGFFGAFFTLIQLAALVSISIGLVNLAPIPILDGGHLVFLGYEAVAGRPPPQGFQEMSYRVGLALLLGVFFIATWSDLSRFGLF